MHDIRADAKQGIHHPYDGPKVSNWRNPPEHRHEDSLYLLLRSNPSQTFAITCDDRYIELSTEPRRLSLQDSGDCFCSSSNDDQFAH